MGGSRAGRQAPGIIDSAGRACPLASRCSYWFSSPGAATQCRRRRWPIARRPTKWGHAAWREPEPDVYTNGILYTSLWPDGEILASPNYVEADGSIVMKFGWFPGTWRRRCGGPAYHRSRDEHGFDHHCLDPGRVRSAIPVDRDHLSHRRLLRDRGPVRRFAAHVRHEGHEGPRSFAQHLIGSCTATDGIRPRTGSGRGFGSRRTNPAIAGNRR